MSGPCIPYRPALGVGGVLGQGGEMACSVE